MTLQTSPRLAERAAHAHTHCRSCAAVSFSLRVHCLCEYGWASLMLLDRVAAAILCRPPWLAFTCQGGCCPLSCAFCAITSGLPARCSVAAVPRFCPPSCACCAVCGVYVQFGPGLLSLLCFRGRMPVGLVLGSFAWCTCCADLVRVQVE